MPTAAAMITTALQGVGNISPGESIAASDMQSALGSLNRLLDSWSTDRLYVFQMFQESFALTANLGTYLIGSGATFNTTRPTQITKSFLRVSGIDYGIEIINDSGFANIAQKSFYAGYPCYLNYNPTLPSGTINIWPLPQANMTLFIQSPKQLAQFSDTTTSVTLAPGYEEAILYALMVRMGAEGLGEANQMQISLAESAVERIKTLNSNIPVMRSEFVSGQNAAGNIFNGFLP